MGSTILILITIIVLIWLSVISYLLLRAVGNYNRLTKGLTEETLSEVLNALLKQSSHAEAEFKKLQQMVDDISKDSVSHTRHIAVVRFNPFADTGGDQSFVLAFLDSEQTGVVITSLYARTGTRWYVKNIRKGKSIEYELSKEEQEAIRKASKS